MNRFKSVVVGVLVAVVVFGGIQVASAHSSSCTRVGATKMQSARTFRCVKTTGKLVWQVKPTSSTTTTTTTTVASPTTTTTVASSTTVVVVPTVSIAATSLQGNTWPKAVSVTSNVVGTVYLVEGASSVGVVADITRLSSQYWMSASITQISTPTVVSVDVVALTNGYYRVYVANSAGVLSQPAINKVTISVTRASTVAATTTTVAISCAAGGTCVAGDTGPGGGIVFYVHASGTFACGATLELTCTSLEAAPAGWSVSPASGCLTAGTSSTDPRCAWSGNTTVLVGATAPDTDIGKGYRNTAAIVGQASGGNTAGRAATASRAYSGGGQSDWFLPSKNELNELCKYARTQTTGNTATACANSGTLRGGFADNFYWSSSEVSATDAWFQDFDNGNQYSNGGKSFTGNFVRPVRAF